MIGNAKEVLKRNATVYNILRCFWHFLKWFFVEVIIDNCFSVFPVRWNKIVVCNFYGKQYGDNPKCIVEELLKKDKKNELDVVWAVNKKYIKNAKFPSGVRAVKYGSLRYLYELATAKVWIDNSRKMIAPRKKRNQFYIQTWHGSIGVKKVEKDANMPAEYVRKAKRDSKNANLFISGSKFLSDLYRSAFWYDGEIVESGSPRIDALIGGYRNKEFVNRMKKKVLKSIGVDGNYRIALYAPTFREKDNGYKLFSYDLFLEALRKKFGSEWILLLRFHPNSSGTGKLEDLPKNVYEITNYPDLYEVLPICDVVVSDYSSVGFEAAMIERKVFIYAPDYDKYKKQERGLYMDYDELPFPFAKTEEALLKNIAEYDSEKNKNENKDLIERLGVHETGKSSQIVADRIMKVIFHNK